MDTLQKKTSSNIALVKEYLCKKYEIDSPKKINFITLSNINFNFEITSSLVNNVFIWYELSQNKPLCVTKIIRSEIHLKNYTNYYDFISNSNDLLKHEFFHKFEIINFKNTKFTLEEFIDQNTYEAFFKNAVLSPMKSTKLLLKYLIQINTELKIFFDKCLDIKFKKKINWYEKFDNYLNIIKEHDSEKSKYVFFANNLLKDNFFIYDNTFVIPDLVNPNIFPGPLFIDNSHNNIDEIHEQIPGILNSYRYIFLTIISPPISFLISDITDFIHKVSNYNEDQDTKLINHYTKMISHFNFSYKQNLTLFIFAIIYEFKERIIIFKDNNLKIEEQITSFNKIIMDIIKLYKLNNKNSFIKKNKIYNILFNQIDVPTIHKPSLNNLTLLNKMSIMNKNELILKIVKKIFKKIFQFIIK